MKVRQMIPADAERVAIIHTKSWQHAYRGLIGQKYLDSIDTKKRQISWENGIIKNDPPMIRLVVELNERILGFACGLENRNPTLLPLSDCEIQAIYVDPLETRKGAGRKLLQYFRSEMKRLNKTRLCVWVLLENHSARRFYEAEGGILSAASKEFKIEGQSLAEVAYEFEV